MSQEWEGGGRLHRLENRGHSDFRSISDSQPGIPNRKVFQAPIAQDLVGFPTEGRAQHHSPRHPEMADHLFQMPSPPAREQGGGLACSGQTWAESCLHPDK
jgi:hypothetical protein